MKKLFLFAAATALLAACSQTDELTESTKTQQQQVEQTPVSFDVYVNKATTRAGDAGDITLDGSDSDPKSISLKVKGFGVFGYYTDDEAYTQYDMPNFMYNMKVTNGGSAWTYSPVMYWPNEFGSEASSQKVDYLTFFAYAPWVDVNPVTGIVTNADKTGNIIGLSKNNVRGDAYVKYVATFDPTNAVDLLWAVQPANPWHQNIDGTTEWRIPGMPFIDLVKEKTSAATTDDGKIRFQFQHALAKLSVNIDADVDAATVISDHSAATDVDAKTRIFVRSITFKGFAGEGALNLNSIERKYSGGYIGIPFWMALDYKSTLAGTEVTVYDGLQNGGEMLSEASEMPATLNPTVISKIGGIIDNPGTSTAAWGSTAPKGVTKSPVSLFNKGTGTSEYVYVIPNKDVFSVTIEYDVETIDPNLTGFLSDGKTHGSIVKNKITSATATGVTFEAGKYYTINLHLGMTTVKMDAAVNEWEHVGTSNVTLPDNK